MTDYTEVQLGHRLLVEYFSREENRKSFYTAVNLCGEGVAEEAVMLFDDWWKNNIRFNTFIGCMSEHDDGEDVHGRLSMWRAFGRLDSRAAIVLNLPAPGTAEGLNVSSACSLFSLRIGPTVY